MPDVETEIAIEVPVVQVVEPAEEPAQPRDNHGRFLSPGETEDSSPNAPEPDIEPVKPVEVVSSPDETAGVGLDIEDNNPPVFGMDGKFVGGRFLGKYDTLDDALVGHKNALKRIGQLEYELSQAQNGEVPQSIPIPLVDPESMTPEEIETAIDAVLGDPEEMTFEDRVAYEENPTRYIAKQNVRRETARRQIFGKAQGIKDATKAAYAKVYDTASPHGERVWRDIKSGNFPGGVPEMKLLLGLGLMAREGMLSGNEPVTKRSPIGRAPETSAAVVAPVRRPRGPSEEDVELARWQKAAYG